MSAAPVLVNSACLCITWLGMYLLQEKCIALNEFSTVITVDHLEIEKSVRIS